MDELNGLASGKYACAARQKKTNGKEHITINANDFGRLLRIVCTHDEDICNGGHRIKHANNDTFRFDNFNFVAIEAIYTADTVRGR